MKSILNKKSDGMLSLEANELKLGLFQGLPTYLRIYMKKRLL